MAMQGWIVPVLAVASATLKQQEKKARSRSHDSVVLGAAVVALAVGSLLVAEANRRLAGENDGEEPEPSDERGTLESHQASQEIIMHNTTKITARFPPTVHVAARGPFQRPRIMNEAGYSGDEYCRSINAKIYVTDHNGRRQTEEISCGQFKSAVDAGNMSIQIIPKSRGHCRKVINGTLSYEVNGRRYDPTELGIATTINITESDCGRTQTIETDSFGHYKATVGPGSVTMEFFPEQGLAIRSSYKQRDGATDANESKGDYCNSPQSSEKSSVSTLTEPGTAGRDTVNTMDQIKQSENDNGKSTDTVLVESQIGDGSDLTIKNEKHVLEPDIAGQELAVTTTAAEDLSSDEEMTLAPEEIDEEQAEVASTDPQTQCAIS